MLHPLCGSNLSNLLLAFARGGSVRPSHLPEAAIALVAALFRFEIIGAMDRVAQREIISAPLAAVGLAENGEADADSRFGGSLPSSGAGWPAPGR